MIALGICDDHDGCAALAIDGDLVVVVDQAEAAANQASAGFPQDAIDAALTYANILPADVDRIVVGGAIGQDSALQQQSGRRSLGRALVRRTGLFMVHADRGRVALTKHAAAMRLTSADIMVEEAHWSLAHGAYRSQPRSDGVVFVAQTRGDGIGLSIWDAEAGQLDCTWSQSELANIVRLPTLYATRRGWKRWQTVDADYDDKISREISEHIGPAAQFYRTESPLRSEAKWFTRLIERHGEGAVGAALNSVVSARLQRWIEIWCERVGCNNALLAGDLMTDAVVEGVGQSGVVQTVWRPPGGTGHGLAMGAVMGSLGIVRKEHLGPGVGRAWTDKELYDGLSVANLQRTQPTDIAHHIQKHLKEGDAVATFRGPSELDGATRGNRAVLRASTTDRGIALRKRAPNKNPLSDMQRLGLISNIAVPADSVLKEALNGMRVHAEPWQQDGRRPATPGEAARWFKSSDYGAMVMGDYFVSA